LGDREKTRTTYWRNIQTTKSEKAQGVRQMTVCPKEKINRWTQIGAILGDQVNHTSEERRVEKVRGKKGSQGETEKRGKISLEREKKNGGAARSKKNPA